MDPMATSAAALIAITAIGVLLLMVRNRRKRARIDSLLSRRGWTRFREGKSTLVRPENDDWTVCVTRSYATQQTPPSTYIVVSTWSSPSPRLAEGTILAGPTPPGPLRDLAIQLLKTSSDRVRGWLGLAKVSHGLQLRPLETADPRLLVLATEATPAPPLAALADAIESWCRRYSAERDQPAVVFGPDGVTVRIRSDAVQTPDRLADFVDLGVASRTALNTAAR